VESQHCVHHGWIERRRFWAILLVVPTARDLLSQLGDNIRAIRTAAGKTQAQVAERAGISAKYLSEIERGTRDLPTSTLHAIVERGLGLKLDIAFATTGPRASLRPLPRLVDELARTIANLSDEARADVLAIARASVRLARRV
jgi:putative transcriptional regulator